MRVNIVMPQTNSISLKQAVEEEPLAVAPETPLLEVIKLMSRDWDNSCVLGKESQQIFNTISQADCSCVLAIANSQVQGILTQQALVELISSGRNIDNITLAEVMRLLSPQEKRKMTYRIFLPLSIYFVDIKFDIYQL